MPKSSYKIITKETQDSMFHFLRDWYKRTKKIWNENTDIYVHNTVHDLRYKIKFENCVKDKNNFFIKRIIAFLSWTKIYFILGGILFKIPKNLVTSAFVFFTEGDTKKHRYALAKASNAALVKLELLKMVMWLIVRCFSVSDLIIAKQAMLFDSLQHGF